MAPFKSTELKSDWRSDFLIEETDCDCEGCGQDPCIKCGESHHNINEQMTDKEFIKTKVDMQTNAKKGVAVSQEKQNAYVKEVNRRRTNKGPGEFKLNYKTDKTNKEEVELQGGVSVETYTKDTKFTEIESVNIIEPEPLVSEGNRTKRHLGSGNKKDMSKGPNEATPVDYRFLVNKGKKTVDPKKNKLAGGVGEVISASNELEGEQSLVE